MKKILAFDKGYEISVQTYTKKDGMLALVLFMIFIGLYCVVALLERAFTIIEDNILLAGGIQNVLLIIITLVFLTVHKQKLDTIGLLRGKWKMSGIIGLGLGFIFFMTNCGSYLLTGSSLIDVKSILLFFVYFLLVSLCEEIVFRGYIQTRIYGIIKNKWLAIIFVALLFTIMHFPYRMIAYNMSLKMLIVDRLSWWVQLFIMHIIWNYIYAKTNSLYGTIFSHLISNLAANIVIK